MCAHLAVSLIVLASSFGFMLTKNPEYFSKRNPFFHSVTKELKQAPFSSHRRKAKVNVSHAGTVVSPRFPN